MIEFHSLTERELSLFFFSPPPKEAATSDMFVKHSLRRKTLQGCDISNHILDTKMVKHTCTVMQNSTVLTKKIKIAGIL